MSAEFPLSSELSDKLHAYLDEVLRANRQFNLTSVRDPELAWSKHVLDSLQGLNFESSEEQSTPLFDGAQKVIDVGTGAGFPGVVLAIARPNLQVTLLEATRKKCNFLEAATAMLTPNAGVLCARAEDAARDSSLRETFDVAVARAVGSFSEVCELCLPFVKVGGKVLLWRGQYAQLEIEESKRALQTLGGQARVLTAYQIPSHDSEYHLVLVEKKKSTPGLYPRRSGLPKKEPL